MHNCPSRSLQVVHMVLQSHVRFLLKSEYNCVHSFAQCLLGDHMWNWGCVIQSSGFRFGVVPNILAIRCFEYFHILPSPQTSRRCSSVCLDAHFRQVSVCTMLIWWRRSFEWIISWMTRYHTLPVVSGTGASFKFFHVWTQSMFGYSFSTHISRRPAAACKHLRCDVYRRLL